MVEIPLSRTLTCSYTLHILRTRITLLFPKHEWSNQYVLLVRFYLLALWMYKKESQNFHIILRSISKRSKTIWNSMDTISFMKSRCWYVNSGWRQHKLNQEDHNITSAYIISISFILFNYIDTLALRGKRPTNMMKKRNG